MAGNIRLFSSQSYRRVLLAFIILFSLVLSSPTPVSRAAPATIIPGVDWRDTSGNLIEAHGAGIIKVGSTYYWFGEDKSDNNGQFKNVNVYSSTDLVTWTFRNRALTRQASGDLGPNRVVERPKVIFNSTTNQYVMYMHIDSANYGEAKVGVATSSVVDGVYTYRGSFQPNGQHSRDMTIFRDNDGSAYLLYSSNNGTQINTPLRTTRLTADYLGVTGGVIHQFTVGDFREAPAVVRVGNTYFMFTSTTSGWDPNPVRYSTATSMAGPWSAWTNLVPSSNTTYRSQSAYVITVQGSSTTSYIYVGDRWQGTSLADSRYVWLPLTLSGTTATMNWYDFWTIDTATGAWAAPPADTGTSYEAEAAANTRNGAAVVQGCSGGSGGQCVGFIGNGSNNWLQINNINVSTAGSRTIRIYYPNADSNYRNASISVNGGSAVTVKFPPTDNVVRSIGITVNLNAGNNTIRFSNSSAYAPDIDRITVPGGGAGTVTVNDNTTGTGNNQYQYTGTWSYGSQSGAYQNDNHWSSSTNANYQVRFNGRQIRLYGARAPNHGIAAVRIDTGTEVNVDFYAATRADNVLLWTSPMLPVGNHTLRVRVTGTRNPSSSGNPITGDRVDITP
jgi:hypothetical protein